LCVFVAFARECNQVFNTLDSSHLLLLVSDNTVVPAIW
jgi:hypothetical protein